MIDGHGDDIYRYEGIRMNFSSNIYAHADLTELEAYLCHHLDLIRSYPEPSSHSLEAMITHEYGVGADEVLVTSGATDAIYLIAQAFRDRKTYYVNHPTFSEYEDACRLYGYEEQPDGALCWLCNPNNPTGEVFSISYIEALAAQHDLLVIDQSYEDYTHALMLSPKEAVRMDNVLQLHSMTKQYAIPGLRVGYVVASSRLIATLRKHYRPWAVNALAIEAGKWLLTHQQVFPNLTIYLQETQRLREQLNAIKGVKAFDTQTNFFLCTIEPQTAASLKDYLAIRHGILIRDASNFQGLTPHHFRIATQLPKENDALVAAIQQFITHSA